MELCSLGGGGGGGGALSMNSELSLANAILTHLMMKDLGFDGVEIDDISIIMYVMKQREGGPA